MIEALCTTGIGSLPLLDAREAVNYVIEKFPYMPYWPQLPKTGPAESMYLQFMNGFPRDGRESLVLHEQGIEQVLADYLDGRTLLPERDAAKGLYYLLDHVTETTRPRFIKGQVTGPISMGLQARDRKGRPALYDRGLQQAICAQLSMHARGQAEALSSVGMDVIISIDEPYLTTLGSGFFAYDSAMAEEYIVSVLRSISCSRALHCCGNTDWSMVLGLPLDIISFDAYGYWEQFCAYAPEIRTFLERGGYIAWGMVPSTEDINRVTAVSIGEQFIGILRTLSQKGLDPFLVVDRSILTPSCGLGSLTPGEARKAISMLQDLQAYLRGKYLAGSLLKK